MTLFVAGDRVKCINTSALQHLNRDEVYTVRNAYIGYISLSGFIGCYSDTHFVHATNTRRKAQHWCEYCNRYHAKDDSGCTAPGQISSAAKWEEDLRRIRDAVASSQQPVQEQETQDPGLNPKDLVGATKAPLALVPPAAIAMVSQVMALGAKKYGAYNWRDKPIQRVTYIEAAKRHLDQDFDGEDVDDEIGALHIAHAAAGLLILLDAISCGSHVDNRPKKGAASVVQKQVADCLKKIDAAKQERELQDKQAAEYEKFIREHMNWSK